MMICFFIFSLCFYLVAGNPLAQYLLQAYQNNQNGFSSNFQPANFYPYNQPAIVQNPQSINTNQVSKSFENQLNEFYRNKVLSNPTLQKFFSLNDNLLNQNGLGIPTNSNSGLVPNVINNYYILPECSQPNENNQPIRIQPKRNRRNKNHSNREKDLQVPLESHNIRDNKQRSHSQNSNNGNEKTKKNNKTKDERQDKKQSEKGKENRSNNNDKSTSKRRKKPIDVNTLEKPNERSNATNGETIEEDITLPKKEEHHEISDNNRKKRKKRPRKPIREEDRLKIDEHNNGKTDIVNKNKNDKDKEHRSRINQNKDKPYSEIEETKNRHMNTKDEAVIKDIHDKFPGIPEDIIRRLLRYLRRQLQKQQLGSNVQHPTYQFPLSYDQLFPPSQLYELVGNHYRNNEKSIRRNSRKRSKNGRKPKPTTLDNASPDVTPAITTETITALSTVKDNNNILEESYNNDGKDSMTLPIKLMDTTTTKESIKLPALGEEDVVPVLNNDVDDYYPDFRDDKIYIDGENNNVWRYHNDRKHYATGDFKLTINQNHGNVEETLANPLEDSYEDLKNIYTEETQFQTPPLLENPDFQTKKINKRPTFEETYYYEHDKFGDNSDKSSTYSDAKIINIPAKRKPKNADVETVSANSKVVKYGQRQDSSKAETDKNSKEDAIIIFAKSIDPEEYW